MTKITEPYSGPIVTRAEALAAGMEWYFHGRPCRRGHHVQRRTSDQQCPECQRVKARFRYAEDPEPARQKTRDKYKADPVAHQKTVQRYRDEHPEKAAESYQLWYAKPENAASKSLYKMLRHAADPSVSRRQSAAWNAANPEAARAIAARCYAKNPAPKKRNAKRRRVMKLACEGSHTDAEIYDLLIKQKGKCAYCHVRMTKEPRKLTAITEDHIIPISAGGSDWISNIAMACKSCNSKKSISDPLVFARKLGRLL